MARKFEWMPFYIDCNTLIAVDLRKKSLQEAESIAIEELECDKPVLIDAYCYYGFCCDEEGELCPELSNLIRDLEKKKDPWIPIKAGTPKPYKNVHIYCANSGIDDVGYYSKYSGKWNLSNGRIAYGVTHWKYLDNSPEVDKDEF